VTLPVLAARERTYRQASANAARAVRVARTDPVSPAKSEASGDGAPDGAAGGPATASAASALRMRLSLALSEALPTLPNRVSARLLRAEASMAVAYGMDSNAHIAVILVSALGATALSVAQADPSATVTRRQTT
jgi:hypothetical protein